MSTSCIRFDAEGAYFTKHPEAVLDVGFDWSEWLVYAGALVIDSSEWTASTGMTASAPQEEGGVTSILISGGVDGSDYTLENKITVGSLVDIRSLRVKVRA